jgi:hypothetical protein
MRLNTAIKRLNENYQKAIKWDFVQKPVSWALYQTRKWADENEKPKKKGITTLHGEKRF